jgi:hypothetical protein
MMVPVFGQNLGMIAMENVQSMQMRMVFVTLRKWLVAKTRLHAISTRTLQILAIAILRTLTTIVMVPVLAISTATEFAMSWKSPAAQISRHATSMLRPQTKTARVCTPLRDMIARATA